MSLDSLLRLRRDGYRPAVPVTLIVGRPSRALDDDPTKAVIDRNPAGMPMHALAGLPFNLIDLAADSALVLAVLDAAEKAGARPVGAISEGGVWGCSQDHQNALWRYREHLRA